jgi:hypothetical protein
VLCLLILQPVRRNGGKESGTLARAAEIWQANRGKQDKMFSLQRSVEWRIREDSAPCNNNIFFSSLPTWRAPVDPYKSDRILLDNEAIERRRPTTSAEAAHANASSERTLLANAAAAAP